MPPASAAPLARRHHRARLHARAGRTVLRALLARPRRPRAEDRAAPGEGDDTRRGYYQLEEGRADQATYFVRINAGKLSVALDLSSPVGREVVLDLARVADVAVENFVPGVAARIGCGYEAFSQAKPDIVYCSISGFGQTGPMRDTPAFHHIINAVSGIMHLGAPDRSRSARRLPASRRRAGRHPRLRRHPGRARPSRAAPDAARTSTSRCWRR